MATATAPMPSPPQTPVASPWWTYVAISDLIRERPVHLTYFQGRLEAMTLSREHEIYKGLLRSFVEIIAEETGMEMAYGGSTTLRRQDVDSGLEADECYW